MFHKKQRKDWRKSGKFCRLEEVVLPNAKLKFCPDQLQNLNYIINRKLQKSPSDISTEKSVLLARSVCEKLVQRLVCGAGMLDPRFSSKYLIRNDGHEINNCSTNLDYMVRLDCLSTPALYETDAPPKYSIIETDSDYPPGYGRIKLHTSTYKVWGDYTNSAGYLRRDKVQARFVELLAAVASKEAPNSPLHIDESVHCGIPGKVVDSFTLYNILKLTPLKHVYYGPGGNMPRFPDPRDFRLAIVDEPSGVRLRVEFLSPALSDICMDIRILVGIGVDAWPATTDFPMRVPLGHSDCLLHHQAAQTGMYLVGYGVQSLAWQIRLPAAENVILNHYGPNSTIKTVLDMLYFILDDINNARRSAKHRASYRVLNRYIFLTLLLEYLEGTSGHPIADMIEWSPLYLSTHLLWLLDTMIPKLRDEKHMNYFFKKSNLLVNPGHLSDDDFAIEADNVRNVLVRFFDESITSISVEDDFQRFISAQGSEMALLYKWKGLVEGLLPPPGTRGRRFCFAGAKNKQDIAHTQYTLRQLEYIGMVLNKMLSVRQNILQVDHSNLEDIDLSYEQQDHMEDLIFILVTIMDQARDQYLSAQTDPHLIRNKLKIKFNFNTYTSKLVDLMRKDKELETFNLQDDILLVKIILKWLYKGMDQNKKCLGPILRPYLSKIFAASHAAAWHIESIKARTNDDEISALGCFSELVISGKITPAEGLIDSVNKRWLWAENMLRAVEMDTLRVVFVPDRGKVFRHLLSLPSCQRNGVQSGGNTMKARSEKQEIRRQKTLPNRSYFSSIINEKCKDLDANLTPQHDFLKKSSPLTLVIEQRHRRGEHRGGGDIFKTLASMQKLSLFQEVASSLPPEDRFELAEVVQHMQSSKSRKSSAKRWSGTLPQMNKGKIQLKNEAAQKYTLKEESAGVRMKETVIDKKCSTKNSNTTLIDSCRAARIREDSSVFYLHDSFKIKSLLSKSDSFKY